MNVSLFPSVSMSNVLMISWTFWPLRKLRSPLAGLVHLHGCCGETKTAPVPDLVTQTLPSPGDMSRRRKDLSFDKLASLLALKFFSAAHWLA